MGGLELGGSYDHMGLCNWCRGAWWFGRAYYLHPPSTAVCRRRRAAAAAQVDGSGCWCCACAPYPRWCLGQGHPRTPSCCVACLPLPEVPTAWRQSARAKRHAHREKGRDRDWEKLLISQRAQLPRFFTVRPSMLCASLQAARAASSVANVTKPNPATQQPAQNRHARKQRALQEPCRMPNKPRGLRVVLSRITTCRCSKSR